MEEALTQKELFAAVRALGLVCTFDADAREYRVTFRADAVPSRVKRENAAYYTNDREDALATAKTMLAAFQRGCV
jgi:hypothetical protein